MKDTLGLILKYLQTINDHKDTVTNYIQTPLESSSGVSNLSTNILTILLALIAGLVALYQVKLNVISSSRISWIESLRNSLCEYLVETVSSITHLKDLIHQIRKHKTTEYPGNDDHYQRYFECDARRQKLEYKCKMYLNTREAKHKEISSLIDKISLILNQPDINQINISEVKEHINEIIPLSTMIFKEEWTKSKQIFTA